MTVLAGRRFSRAGRVDGNLHRLRQGDVLVEVLLKRHLGHADFVLFKECRCAAHGRGRSEPRRKT